MFGLVRGWPESCEAIIPPVTEARKYRLSIGLTCSTTRGQTARNDDLRRVDPNTRPRWRWVLPRWRTGRRRSNALMKRTLAGVNVTVTLSTIVLPPLLKRRKHRAGFYTYEWRGI